MDRWASVAYAMTTVNRDQGPPGSVARELCQERTSPKKSLANGAPKSLSTSSMNHTNGESDCSSMARMKLSMFMLEPKTSIHSLLKSYLNLSCRATVAASSL